MLMRRHGGCSVECHSFWVTGSFCVYVLQYSLMYFSFYNFDMFRFSICIAFKPLLDYICAVFVQHFLKHFLLSIFMLVTCLQAPPVPWIKRSFGWSFGQKIDWCWWLIWSESIHQWFQPSRVMCDTLTSAPLGCIVIHYTMEPDLIPIKQIEWN